MSVSTSDRFDQLMFRHLYNWPGFVWVFPKVSIEITEEGEVLYKLKGADAGGAFRVWLLSILNVNYA